MIFIEKFQDDPKGILYLGDYHPWHKGRNPKFDDFSGAILDLKEGIDKAVEKFRKLLDPLLAEGIAIATVPSHEVGESSFGLSKLAEALARNRRTDATGCLVRHKAVKKLTRGGNRSITTHLESIKVVDVDLVRGKEVLLLDDVATTGNSLRACQQLLVKTGAANVQCFAVGQTVEE